MDYVLPFRKPQSLWQRLFRRPLNPPEPLTIEWLNLNLQRLTKADRKPDTVILHPADAVRLDKVMPFEYHVDMLMQEGAMRFLSKEEHRRLHQISDEARSFFERLFGLLPPPTDDKPKKFLN